MNYLSGFGNEFASEALVGALPIGQNNPLLANYGLYTEQISGSAFTTPRHKNLRSWLYRILPSVIHEKYELLERQHIFDDVESLKIDPNQIRWDPIDFSNITEEIDFISGLKLICGSGSPTVKQGVMIYNYAFNKAMVDKSFSNSDGDFLIVPQIGSLFLKTEFGNLIVSPCEIVVVPRGIKFSVSMYINTSAAEEEQCDSSSSFCRGYISEVFQGHFELPTLGLIGSNGLANPRDFKYPTACFEEMNNSTSAYIHITVNKFGNKLFSAKMSHSPFNVVAWHGNYCPFKYDLRTFNCINTVSFDHPDPSIYTVLTCPTTETGVSALDFVIFPPRWLVAENTFRPPYFHRNCMSEYMGLIYGKYDAKCGSLETKKGFIPGGSSLHSIMSAHGPDSSTFQKAVDVIEQTPQYFDQGLAFMFESNFILQISQKALQDTDQNHDNLYPKIQDDYQNCWKLLPQIFSTNLDIQPVISMNK